MKRSALAFVAGFFVGAKVAMNLLRRYLSDQTRQGIVTDMDGLIDKVNKKMGCHPARPVRPSTDAERIQQVIDRRKAAARPTKPSAAPDKVSPGWAQDLR